VSQTNTRSTDASGSSTLRSLHRTAVTCGSWRSVAALVMCATNFGAMSTP
jgi:hypothetical protein